MKRRIFLLTVLMVLSLSVVSVSGVAAQSTERSYIVLGTAESGISAQTMNQARLI